MKKISLLVMPLVAVSLLASCGGKTPVEHFVTFESYGGGHFPTQRIKDGDSATKPENSPVRGDDTFLGWFTDFDKPAYTFTEAVTDDITLYAGWDEALDPVTSFRFNFTGYDCKINGLTSFECNIGIGAQTQFAIIPDGARSFPPKDNEHWIVKEGEGTFTYDPLTGYIKIGNMTSNIEIEAFASGPATKYNISFTGEDCKAKGESVTVASESFQIEDVPGGQNYSFVIEPNSDFALDGSIGTFLVNGVPSTAYEYKFGEGGKYNLNFTLTGNTLISIAANPVAYKRHVSFNMTDCTMKWGTTEITSTGVDIPVLDVNPYYVKFSVKASDNIYMKPGTLSLNSGAYTDYSFNKDNGDLFINLQKDIVVTGTCDMYKTLEECSWSQIETISKAGNAPEAFKVGDEKEVNLFDISSDINTRTKQNFTHKVRIIGFNHDKDANGNDLGITFEFKNVITKGATTPTDAYTTIWDGIFDTSGDNFDYRSSVLNKALNDETSGVDSIINRLPDDLKGVIKPADKKVGVNEGKQEGAQYYEAKSFKTGEYPKLFPLAHDEMVDHDDCAVQDEGTKYQYYIDHPNQADRIKTKVGGGGEYYWLRSPDAGNSNCAWGVNGYGWLYYSSVYIYAFAVAPAFCI